MPKRILPLVVLLITLTLAACGNGAASPPTPEPRGNPENGKALFNQPALANGPGCTTCHGLEPGQVIVGPSMAGVAGTAGNTIQKPGYKGDAANAADYLRESIAEPDIYAAEGFSTGVMPKNYADLSAQELDDLVAYLLTLQ
jgi:nitric oxide reductase subunit C